MNKEPRLIVALDFDERASAINLLKQLDPMSCRIKIGKQMFSAFGPDFVKQCSDLGFGVFLDLKYHDIPNTVAGACAASAKQGVWMMNVHALGGAAMLRAARQAIDKMPPPMRPLLIGVTILTSMGQDDLHQVGIDTPLEDCVLKLSKLCYDCGLDGVVCSPQEVLMLRSEMHADFKLITPGIRLQDSAADDQQRIMTPKMAIDKGASYLVVGRPITLAQNPAQVVVDILASISPHSVKTH